MAKRVALPFKDLAVELVGSAGSFLASRVQRFDSNTNLPSNDIDELGNPNHAGVVTGTPEVSLTVQAMDVSVKIFSALTGTSATAYPAQGVGISSLGDIDVIGRVKDDKVSTYVKCIHGRKLRISGFKFSYSVGGEATEEYTAQGTERRWFKNDVIVYKSTSVGKTFTLPSTPATLKNGNKCISVILDGSYLTEVASLPATGEYSVSSTTLTTGDTLASAIVVVYHVNTTDAYVSVVDNTIPAGIKGKNIPVKISANNISRVQSININGTLPTTKVEEQGSVDIVGYTTQVPQVTGDIAVLDTDLELIALLSTGNMASTDTEFRDCELTPSGISLSVELHDPASGCTTSGAVLKTVYLPAITITSEAYTTNVGNNATLTYNFKSTYGDCIIYSGLKP